MGIDNLTVLIAEGDVELDDENRHAHIIGPIYNEDGSKISGSERAMQARVNGTPVEALCGYTWVPSRDPDKYPLCQACKAINERNRDS